MSESTSNSARQSVKLGAPSGSSEGQHDKFVFEAENAADLDGWMYTRAPTLDLGGIHTSHLHTTE